MRVLRAADRIVAPWKNGGGTTREVAAWPAGAGFEDFHWRVSMAEVASDGPFSIFPDVDRILAVLEGRLRLGVTGHAAFDLVGGGAPARFPGDAPALAEVVDGPVLDLNLMSRRDHVRARLERLEIGPTALLAPEGFARLVLAVDLPVCVQANGSSIELGQYDGVLAGPADGPLRMDAACPTHAYLASFEAA